MKTFGNKKTPPKYLMFCFSHAHPMTFIVNLTDTIKWIDEDAPGLSREDVLDGVRARLVDITHKFVAYPHCANFSLMPEGDE